MTASKASDSKSAIPTKSQSPRSEEASAESRVAVKDDWRVSDMPDQHERFIFRRHVSPTQMEILRQGHVPMEMEDKWFWYMEGDSLFAYRSWTGHCIFRIDFSASNNHWVTINRDPEQYRSISIDDDIEMLNSLLDWWVRSPYDYYNEWVCELTDAIASAKSPN